MPLWTRVAKCGLESVQKLALTMAIAHVMQWTHISHFWSPFFFLFLYQNHQKPEFQVSEWKNNKTNWFPAVTVASIIHYFYIALFSALEQTHCTHVMWFWLYPFIVHIFNINGSGVLIATWNCCRLGASSVYTIQPCPSLQCHFIQSHKHAVFHTTRDSEVIVQLPEWQATTVIHVFICIGKQKHMQNITQLWQNF